MIRKIVGVLLLAISMLSIGAEPLVVGMELAYPPFEMSDEKGNPTGISVEMAYALGEYLGREVIIEDMAYGGLIPALKTNKIDIILSSLSVTEDRKKSVNFTDAYAKSHLAMLTNKESGIENPEDLNQKGKKIAVKKGTSGHTVAQKYFPNAEILVFDKETAIVLEVSQGKVDAFLYDPLTIYKNWNRNQETTEMILEKFEETPQEWAIAYRKGDEELGTQMNEFIEIYKKDGGFDRLATKYLGKEKEIFKEQNVPFFFD